MLRNPAFPYLPKDYVQTAEDLIFAIVTYAPQDGKIGCFLRYIKRDGQWQKVKTEQANLFLQENHPQYLFYSAQTDSHFHAVPHANVVYHYQPELGLKEVLKKQDPDQIQRGLADLISVLKQYGVDLEYLGLTGSMLLGFQKAGSDIDLAVYGNDAFHCARNAVRKAIQQSQFNSLDDAMMRDNYERRAGELDYKSFAWHEARKYNKAVIAGIKFDIGMVCINQPSLHQARRYKKQGMLSLRAQVTKDDEAFSFPAKYMIDNVTIPEVISYSHTYVGQAQKGETIEIRGALELETDTGHRRLVVGSTRESIGEYIKVSRDE